MNNITNYLKSLLKKNDKVVIACSGGPDSMYLLNFLVSLKNELNLKLIVAHVNHNVRKESIKEAEFVSDYCQKNDLIFESMVIENYNDDNFHNQARKIRYEFFENLVKKYKVQYLMTAHHADDLMETILMRISRGSTLKGYAGFEKETNMGNYQLIRPLIEVTKKEIEYYLKVNKIMYCIDKSNQDDYYTRNRYRHNILEFLKKEDENVHLKYLEFQKTLNEYNSFVDKIVMNEIKKVYINKKIDIKKFIKLDTLIQNKIIEYILYEEYNDDLFLVSNIHVKSIIDLIYSNKASGKMNLPNNKIVIKSYNELSFTDGNENHEDYEIILDNEVDLLSGKIIKLENSNDTSNFVTRINSKEIKLPLIVRNHRDNDKMAVKNLLGTKKIRSIFIDEKVKINERNIWPIITDSNNEIIFLPGLKKSKFDKSKDEIYDIIIKYELKKGENINE